jgi:hypothetical protein
MKANSLLLILVLAVASAVAQRGGMGPGPGFKYDASAETRFTGTIEQINTMNSTCHTGTHLVLKTDKGDVEVALGPSQFLEDQKLELKKGQTVDVVGAKTTTGRGEIFITRQITTAGKTINLRDEKGIPSWPRGVCR